MTAKLFGWILLAVIILGVLIWSLFHIKFYQEVLQELKKVTWPSKDEALRSAVITVAFIITFSLCLAGIDFVVSYVMLKVVG